jgi:hypothetical protein
MATIVLTPDLQRFPVGTSVGAYPRTAWPADRLAGAPSGAAVETQAVQANGTLTFTTLTPNLDYVGYVASPDRYMPFSIRSRQLIQAARVDIGALTGAQSPVDITLTWPVPFADTNYTVTTDIVETAGPSAGTQLDAKRQVLTKTAAGISVRMSNGSGAYSAGQLFLHAIAVHD